MGNRITPHFVESPNRSIYDHNYTAAQLNLDSPSAYDQAVIERRFALIKQYGTGKRVLDLGCGSGVFLIPALRWVQQGTGVDFSQNMLTAFRQRLKNNEPENLTLLQADIRNLPLTDESFDLVYSFASLYHVPDPEIYFSEISRVLVKGGIACLELGNYWSLNTVFAYIWHKTHGWAKPFHLPIKKMKKMVRQHSLRPLDWRSFQLIPLYRAPWPTLFLHPLCGAHWKRPLALRWKGRLLDEHVSSLPLLRGLAFRQCLTLEKV